MGVATVLRAVDESGPLSPSDQPEGSQGRTTALVVIAVLLTTGALWLAKSLIVPIVLGILISYALDPIQRRVVAWGVPRALAAALIIVAALTAAGFGLFALRDQASAFVAKVPVVAEHLKETIERYRQSGVTP